MLTHRLAAAATLGNSGCGGGPPGPVVPQPFVSHSNGASIIPPSRIQTSSMSGD